MSAPLKTTEEWNREYACMAPEALIKAIRVEMTNHIAEVITQMGRRPSPHLPDSYANITSAILDEARKLEGK